LDATREQNLGVRILGLSSGSAAVLAVTLLWAYWPAQPPADEEIDRVTSHLGASGPAEPVRLKKPGNDPGDLLVADLRAIRYWTRLDLADIEKAGFEWADVTTPGRWRHGPGRNETHQAFSTYQRAQQRARDRRRKVIVIRPLGAWPERLRHIPPLITRYLMIYFRRPVRWEDAQPLPGRHRVNGDGAELHLQYPTQDILDRLIRTLPDDAIAHVALTAQDLYPAEDWGFVFGMADLDKRVGVISLARLFPRFWGFVNTPLARRLALLRTLKVLAHEIGHMLGVNHCRAFTCLMSGCTGLVEHDTTPLHLCPLCMAKLGWRLNLNVQRRYHDLAQFFMKHDLSVEARWYHRQAVRLADAQKLIKKIVKKIARTSARAIDPINLPSTNTEAKTGI
jgi:archaemetzincin